MVNNASYYISEYSGFEQTVLASILGFIMLFSFYGNFGMLIVLYKNDKMWNSTNILIGNLAITGVLTTLFSMPFSFTSILITKWPFGEGPVCKFNAFLNSQLLLITIFIHTLISVDKYYAVVKPFSRAMTVKRTWRIIFLAWFIAITMSLGPLFSIGQYRYNRTALICGVGFPTSKIDSLYLVVLFVIGFIIPNIMSAHVYLKVFFAVRNHSKRLHQTSIMCSLDVVKLQKKLILTAFFSLVCFLFCWTPFAVYVTMAIISKSIEKIPHGLGVSAYWSGYLYNAVNPLIICSMSNRFREGLYELTLSIIQTPLKAHLCCQSCIYDDAGWEKGMEQASSVTSSTDQDLKKKELTEQQVSYTNLQHATVVDINESPDSKKGLVVSTANIVLTESTKF